MTAFDGGSGRPPRLLRQQGLQLHRHDAGHLLAHPTENVMVTAHSDGWGDCISWIDVRLAAQSDDWYRAFGGNDSREGLNSRGHS
jgi:hypothetical protein